MKLIEKLSDMIEEEIGDAGKYARCALMYKDEKPDVARTFFDLSNQEMGHMQILHNLVVNLISEYKREHGDPPQYMQDRYEWLHERHVEDANEVRVIQAAFNR